MLRRRRRGNKGNPVYIDAIIKSLSLITYDRRKAAGKNETLITSSCRERAVKDRQAWFRVLRVRPLKFNTERRKESERQTLLLSHLARGHMANPVVNKPSQSIVFRWRAAFVTNIFL